MKKQPFLLVMSIIMIVCGAISVISNFASMSSLAWLSAFGISTGLLWVAVIISILGGAAEIVAGIIGCMSYKDPSKAGKCVTWGIIVIALAILADLLIFIGYADFISPLNLVLGLVVPVLYLVAAFIAKKSDAPAA